MALLKSPVIMNAASGSAVSCLVILPNSSLSACSVLAWGGGINTCDYDRCKFPRKPEWSTQQGEVFQIRVAQFVLFCVGLGGGGGKTPVIMTAVNSIGSQNGRHSRVRYSRSGEHKDLTECMFLSWHHELLIKKQTPPPLLFLVNSFILSARRISRVRWLNLESPDS